MSFSPCINVKKTQQYHKFRISAVVKFATKWDSDIPWDEYEIAIADGEIEFN